MRRRALPTHGAPATSCSAPSAPRSGTPEPPDPTHDAGRGAWALQSDDAAPPEESLAAGRGWCPRPVSARRVPRPRALETDSTRGRAPSPPTAWGRYAAVKGSLRRSGRFRHPCGLQHSAPAKPLGLPASRQASRSPLTAAPLTSVSASVVDNDHPDAQTSTASTSISLTHASNTRNLHLSGSLLYWNGAKQSSCLRTTTTYSRSPVGGERSCYARLPVDLLGHSDSSTATQLRVPPKSRVDSSSRPSRQLAQPLVFIAIGVGCNGGLERIDVAAQSSQVTDGLDKGAPSQAECRPGVVV